MAESRMTAYASQQPLRVEQLEKSFGSRIAVNDLSFTVEAGEVLGLLGPNGAGKTTTISCIAGLERPDRGTISVCGADPSRGGRKRGAVGLATQVPGLYEPLDAERNLRFFAAIGGVTGRDLDRCVRRVIERFDLGPMLGRRVGALSGGQRRLLHVAAAVVGRPRLVLLDEATANLDVDKRIVVIEAIRELADEGCAFVYSSHYLDEVEDLCERVLILHEGLAIADSSVTELVREFGGGRVEFGIGERRVAIDTCDLSVALQSVVEVGEIREARVVRPSLEAVFASLTGVQIDEHGFSHVLARPEEARNGCETF
jgi:ABC-2 type transport system ATP-binding protein